MSFNAILEKYRNNAFSARDQGDRFERLMQAYLLTDPQYAGLFRKVWLWNDFPGKADLGGGDTGIDLVAVTHHNAYWAIQCKCYKETTAINKPAVDSFLATSSRQFRGEDQQTTRFAQRLWISTSNNWGPNAEEALTHLQPPYYHQPDSGAGVCICRKRQISHRMDHGTLAGEYPQGKRHRQRPERLVTRTRQAELHIRPLAQHHQREHADGGHCKQPACFEFWQCRNAHHEHLCRRGPGWGVSGGS
jgi:hypothetical protein